MFDTEALAKGVAYHPRVQGLPEGEMWGGEDRSLAIAAERLHVEQYADPWPDIVHLYSPADRTPEAIAEGLEIIETLPQSYAKPGDLVNFNVELMDAPERPASLSFRGRIGGLELLPEIEAALYDMKPGEERIVKAIYPSYWPANGGRPGILRVTLNDVKPFGYVPVFALHAMRGLA